MLMSEEDKILELMRLIRNSIFKNCRDRNEIYNIGRINEFKYIEDYQDIMIPLFTNEMFDTIRKAQMKYKRLFMNDGESQQIPIQYQLDIENAQGSIIEYNVKEIDVSDHLNQQERLKLFWKYKHYNEYLTYINTSLNFVAIFFQDKKQIQHSLGVIKQYQQRSSENIKSSGILYIPNSKYFLQNLYQQHCKAYIQPLGSTSTYFTELEALSTVHQHPDSTYIKGTVPKIKLQTDQRLEEYLNNGVFQRHFNEYQKNAIRQAHCSNQLFTLIDGPPGTGKTQTTIGIISTIFRLYPNPNDLVLILARTNTVVNDLVRRINKHIKSAQSIFNFDNKLKGFPWKIMRTGRAEKCDEDIKSNSMEIMAQIEFFKHYEDKLSEKCKTFCRDRGLNEINLIYLLEIIEKDSRQGRRTKINKQNLDFMGQIYQELQILLKKYNREYLQLQKDQLNKCNILVSTLNSCHQDVVCNFLEKKSIRFCIIDEAPTALESSMLIPMTKYFHIKKYVLLGDVKQLSPLINSDVSIQYGFNRSMYERFSNLVTPIRLLIQYRQAPIMAKITSELFYNGKLQSANYVEVPEYLSNLIPKEGSCIFFNSGNNNNELQDETSFYNESEAKAILILAKYLLTDIDLFLKPGFRKMISIIVAYKKQLQFIRNLFSNTTDDQGNYLIDLVEIDTIDAFQGKENDIIIISLVRSGDNMGFLDDQHRMNVALSRARYGQFIFGNRQCLQTTLTKWSRFLFNLNVQGFIIDYPQKINEQFYRDILAKQNIIFYIDSLVTLNNQALFFKTNNEIIDMIGTNQEAIQICQLVVYFFKNITSQNKNIFMNSQIITIVATEQQLKVISNILSSKQIGDLNCRYIQFVKLVTFENFAKLSSEQKSNFIIIVSLHENIGVSFLQQIERENILKSYAQKAIFIFGKDQHINNATEKWQRFLENLQSTQHIIEYEGKMRREEIESIMKRK